MDYFKRLEDIIGENLNSRGMDRAYIASEIENAAKILIKSNTIIIATGFVIKDTLIGETDGPLGAISVASALDKLGKRVVIITDIYSKSMIEAALKVVDLKVPLDLFTKGEEDIITQHILNKYKPDCLLSIERPGEASDGNIYSMRGERISDIIPSMDCLFREAGRLGLSTIGIGDGGNEIGMGKIKQYVIENIPKGNIIAASFATDYLIVAGVSNWGGHALVAGLSKLSQRSLLYSIETEIQILKAIVNAGAVDGLTKESTLTVDGISLEDNIRIFEMIKFTIKEELILEQEA